MGHVHFKWDTSIFSSFVKIYLLERGWPRNRPFIDVAGHRHILNGKPRRVEYGYVSSRYPALLFSGYNFAKRRPYIARVYYLSGYRDIYLAAMLRLRPVIHEYPRSPQQGAFQLLLAFRIRTDSERQGGAG